jgi:hypothetical protein
VETKVEKAARVEKQALDDAELALINKQALRELTTDEVFTFKIAACNDQVDRDYEHFSEKTLADLAALYVGKTVIMDHNWSAANQTARIYTSGVEPMAGGGKQLALRAYMLRSDESKETIDRIESGILREVSVSCSTQRAVCDICGADKRITYCEHRPGNEYDGKTATVTLDGAADAYEVSFVAVPAQREAGTIKKYGGEDTKPAPKPTKTALTELRLRSAKAKLNLLELEGK